jgi:hypothetical protein
MNNFQNFQNQDEHNIFYESDEYEEYDEPSQVNNPQSRISPARRRRRRRRRRRNRRPYGAYGLGFPFYRPLYRRYQPWITYYGYNPYAYTTYNNNLSPSTCRNDLHCIQRGSQYCLNTRTSPPTIEYCTHAAQCQGVSGELNGVCMH